ncbi:MAG: signal transduction histidine kinase [Myxococcota bacterium]
MCDLTSPLRFLLNPGSARSDDEKMNPVSTLRFRRLTGLSAVTIAAVTILVTAVHLVPAEDGLVFPVKVALLGGSTVVQAATDEAIDAGVLLGDDAISVDGIPMLRVLRNSSSVLRSGETNRFGFLRDDGSAYELDLHPAPIEFSRHALDLVLDISLLAVSIFYLMMGGMVWRSKSDRAEAWAFMLFCAAMSAELAAWARMDVVPYATTRLLATTPFLGATAFHLFSTYPLEPPWIVRHRRIRLLPYFGAGVLSAMVLSGSWVATAYDVAVANIAFGYGLGLCAVSLVVLASERGRARLAGVGDRMDMVLMGGIASFFPAMMIVIAEYYLQASFPPYLALLWVVFLPAAIGIGMLRRHRFELSKVAKSSAAYGAATLAITGLFALMITFADQAAQGFGMTMQSAQVVFLFFAILAFNPLRDRLQRLVDGIFDRDRSRYRAAVREISEAMVSMLSLREIGDRILAALTDTMGVERAMVMLFDEDNRMLRPSVWRGDWDEEEREGLEIPAEHPIWRHLWMRREELCRADFDEEPDPENRELCRDVFDSLEVELLVPVLFGVDLLGVIAVGRKLSGEALAADDRQLLRTLANQSAIAMENAKSFDEIGKLNETLEARVEERTAELQEIQVQLMQSEKLSSLGQLVAGVAHELNNPIGFVHANLQLLDEFIEKLSVAHASGADTEKIREAIAKLLARSREGTHRVKEIVQDLRTFSRMDQADLQDANLHEELDRTIGLMEPRFKDGVTVVRDYGNLPTVRCYPGQLNQVFLNLLMNACDAMNCTGSVVIRTRQTEDGVRLEFQDDGPGVPPELLNRLFEPFFTTKEVGKGTGLGLSLSHGIIERHGGKFSIKSNLGEGATFVIELPLDASPQGAVEFDPASAAAS